MDACNASRQQQPIYNITEYTSIWDGALYCARFARRHCQANVYWDTPIYKRLVVSTFRLYAILRCHGIRTTDDKSQPIINIYIEAIGTMKSINHSSAYRRVKIAIFHSTRLPFSMRKLLLFFFFSISTQIPAIQRLFNFALFTLTKRNKM